MSACDSHGVPPGVRIDATILRSTRPERAKPAAFRIMSLPAIPIIDIRDGGPLDHARQNAEQARALRDACLAFFPAVAKPLVPALDWASRRWLGRSRSPYVAEIARIAAALNFSGIWLLNASYQWGCTARGVAEERPPWRLRSLAPTSTRVWGHLAPAPR